MKHVGSYEAKTHLSSLLEEIMKGEKVTITKHGVPVALLSPAEGRQKKPVNEIIDELRKFRKKHTLQSISLRELIEEGRR